MRSTSPIASMTRRAPVIAALAAAVIAAAVPVASVGSAADADPIVARALQHVAAESVGIDATLQALRDAHLADALAGAHARGVQVRVIVPEPRYRDAADPWHAWNVDRLHAAGVQVRQLRQAGPPEDALLVLHGQGMVVLGSVGATAPGGAPPAAFAQFATPAWMYAWAVDRFTRLWHNGAGHEETVAFSPLPAGTPQPVAPADDADGAVAPVMLRWQPGPWAHLYDVYVGVSPGELVRVVTDAALDPGRDPGEPAVAALPELAADTTYYWQVVSRTMAGLERGGPVWSFRTDSAAPVGTSGRLATARVPESVEASLGAIVEPAVLEALVQRRSPQGGETDRVAVLRSGDEWADPVPPLPVGSAPAAGTPPSGRAGASGAGDGPSGDFADARSPVVVPTDDTTSPSTGDAGEPQLPSPPLELMRVDFQRSPTGEYTEQAVRADWPGLRRASLGRAVIVEEEGNRFVRVSYPKGGVGPAEGGVQWFVTIAPHEELWLRYRVRFGDGFEAVLGGKLPGLTGGAANTGGSRPDGTDGWSARMMWQPSLRMIQYVYHPDQRDTHGDGLPWRVAGKDSRFSTGRWHVVEHRIVMNTPGWHDGILQAWLDGELSLDIRNLRFRDVPSLAIDGLYFSTFFGGSSADWAPVRDEIIDFDDFLVSTGRAH